MALDILVQLSFRDRLFAHHAYLADRFANFTAEHFASLAAVAVLIAGALLLAARASERGERRFEIGLGCAMLGGTAVQILWSALSGHFEPGYDLIVFHLCGMTSLVGAVLLLRPEAKRGRFLPNVLYFAGIPGALMALATPDLPYAFPHFMNAMFFLSHAMIVLSALHLVRVRRFRPEPKRIPAVFLALNAVLVPVYLVDRLTGGNYFFLIEPPANTLAIVFAEWVGWGWYLIPMEAVALLAFGLFALPWIRWGRRRPREPQGMV